MSPQFLSKFVYTTQACIESLPPLEKMIIETLVSVGDVKIQNPPRYGIRPFTIEIEKNQVKESAVGISHPAQESTALPQGNVGKFPSQPTRRM